MPNLSLPILSRFRNLEKEDNKSRGKLLGKNILDDALELIGTSAFGVQYILAGGLTAQPAEWIDPVFLKSSVNQPNVSDALSKLTDSSNPEYVQPEEVLVPGVGLLGSLWNDIDWGQFHTHNDSNRNLPATLKKGLRSEWNVMARMSMVASPSRKLQDWDNYLCRDLEYLASDPDHPYDPRLQLLVQAGIGYAIAVPYNVNDDRGLVIFGFRTKCVYSRVKSVSSLKFLKESAAFLGSVKSFRNHYSIARHERQNEASEARRKIRDSLIHRSKRAVGRRSIIDVESQDPSTLNKKKLNQNKCNNIKQKICDIINPKVISYFQKWLGTQTTCPPPLSTYHSLFCFFATFISCLIWGLIDRSVTKLSSGNISLKRGSFGSLVAAQYLLMAAPASQPSNAFFSQFMCGIIAITINNIPYLPSLFRISLTPALVVLIMGKTGFIHPTTGGDALLYAYDGNTTSAWIQPFIIILFNYIIGIVLSTVINNISIDRQYPNYWFPRFHIFWRKLCKKIHGE